VITARNVHEVPALIEVARRYGTSLKLLDLVNMSAPAGHEEWLRDFVPFSEVRKIIEGLAGEFDGLEETPGGVGAPLLSFRMPDGLQVVMKDSLYGLCYGASCRECPKYPCQDAVISLRVTHDGRLKKCLVRDDNLVPLRQQLLNRDGHAVENSLGAMFQELTSSRLVPGVWSPTVVPGQARTEQT
jgi:cyclic pyranopterin phosphate synthase